MACLALCHRLQEPPAEEKTRVTSPADGANLLLPRLRHLAQEEGHVLLLDTRNYVIGTHCIYRGSLNSSTIRIGAPCVAVTTTQGIVEHGVERSNKEWL